MELLVILKSHFIGFYPEANAEDRPIERERRELFS